MILESAIGGSSFSFEPACWPSGLKLSEVMPETSSKLVPRFSKRDETKLRCEETSAGLKISPSSEARYWIRRK